MPGAAALRRRAACRSDRQRGLHRCRLDKALLNRHATGCVLANPCGHDHDDAFPRAASCDAPGPASGSPPVEWTNSAIEVATDGSVSQRIEFWRETILRLFADVQIAAVQKADFFGVRQRKCEKMRISKSTPASRP